MLDVGLPVVEGVLIPEVRKPRPGRRYGLIIAGTCDCGVDCCAGDAEAPGGMSDATVAVATGWDSAAVATFVEVRFEAAVVEVNTASPEEPDC